MSGIPTKYVWFFSFVSVRIAAVYILETDQTTIPALTTNHIGVHQTNQKKTQTLRHNESLPSSMYGAKISGVACPSCNSENLTIQADFEDDIDGSVVAQCESCSKKFNLIFEEME